MDRVKIPIRTNQSDRTGRAVTEEKPAVAEAPPPVVEKEPIAPEEPLERPRPKKPMPSHATGKPPMEKEEDLEVWRDRAMRLQAEMENFRKRQRRLADERIEADRGRLLRNFLAVTDDLERALNTDGASDGSLREGVEMTHRSMMKLLEREGAEQIEAKGQSFDPTWHEAVSAVPHEAVGVEPDTVVEVTQPGYRIGERLLRPARVVVAT